MVPPPHDWTQGDLTELINGAAAAPVPVPVPVSPETVSPAGQRSGERSLQAVLILDTETTGLDPEQDQCCEVGAVLFSVPERSVLAQLSVLLPVATNAAEGVNRIPAHCTRLPQPWRQGLELLASLAADADCAVAHNVAFDRPWFGRGALPDLGLPWICTMEEVDWPEHLGLRPRPSVRDLALAHGVPVWAAHRALTDCIYLAEVFRRCDELPRLLDEAREPRQLLRAVVGYGDRQLAKQAGFRWNDPIEGAWTRRLSARQLERLALPFATEVLEA